MELVIEYQSPFHKYSETPESSLPKTQFTRKVKATPEE